MSWLGKDGKWYDDLNDCVGANNLYEQQEKQNELLAIQNSLIQQNIYEKEKIEKNRIFYEKNLEKEKRIDKIFDSIGISRKEFIKFKENYLLLYDNNNASCYEEKNNLEEELIYLKKKYINKSNVTSEILKNNKITLSDINNLNMNGIKEKFIIYKLTRIWCYIWWIFLILISMILVENGLPKSSTAPLIIILLISIVPYFLYFKIKSEAMKIIENYAKDKSKEKSKLKVLEEKINIMNEKFQYEEKENKNKMMEANNEFTLFRKQHYNNNFEKFLLDLNIDEIYEKYNIKFIKINNNNKISDGKIEDYVAFIQEKNE